MLGPFDQPKTPEVKKVLNDKKVSDHHAIIPTVELAEFDFSKLREWEQKILFLIAVHTRRSNGRRSCIHGDRGGSAMSG